LHNKRPLDESDQKSTVDWLDWWPSMLEGSVVWMDRQICGETFVKKIKERPEMEQKATLDP
jgi:hypothetical protein